MYNNIDRSMDSPNNGKIDSQGLGFETFMDDAFVAFGQNSIAGEASPVAPLVPAPGTEGDTIGTAAASVASALTSQDNEETGETEEEKKTRRLLASRRAGKESRQRRKQLVFTLSATVDELTSEKRLLIQENAMLRAEIDDLKQKIRMTLAMCRQQQQMQPQRQDPMQLPMQPPGQHHGPTGLPRQLEMGFPSNTDALHGDLHLPVGPHQGRPLQEQWEPLEPQLDDGRLWVNTPKPNGNFFTGR